MRTERIVLRARYHKELKKLAAQLRMAYRVIDQQRKQIQDLTQENDKLHADADSRLIVHATPEQILSVQESVVK